MTGRIFFKVIRSTLNLKPQRIELVNIDLILNILDKNYRHYIIEFVSKVLLYTKTRTSNQETSIP